MDIGARNAMKVRKKFRVNIGKNIVLKKRGEVYETNMET